MARIKIGLPDKFVFTTKIPVRISDVNYGGHVGNDSILSIIHEIRVQYFESLGYTELKFAGVGIIMSDVAIEFKNELFYGEEIIASLAIGEITAIAFDIFYKLEKKTGDKLETVANAKTWIVCYDYSKKKVTPIPEEILEKIKHQ